MSSFLPATTDSIVLALEAKDPSEGISILYRVLGDPSSSPEALRMKEKAITNLTDLLRQEKGMWLFGFRRRMMGEAEIVGEEEMGRIMQLCLQGVGF
ncbi:hypothetical protein RYX36_034127 [Vicia faba]